MGRDLVTFWVMEEAPLQLGCIMENPVFSILFSISSIKTYVQNRYLNHLVDPRFQGVHLFYINNQKFKQSPRKFLIC